MSMSRLLRRSVPAAIVSATFLWLGAVTAADVKSLNSAAIKITSAENIKWTTSPSGSSQAILAGDPAKPGMYIVLTKWSAGHMSRPHSHPNDRFITVISGTWWVGTGNKYDPDSTVPVQAGSSVIHYGGQLHYDGAKEGDCVLQISGIGPADSTPAK